MRCKLELLWALIVRDILIKYKQSLVGIAWSLIQPLALMFVFDLVFGRLLQTDTEGVPYPIFVYSCLLPWTFFSSSLVKGTSSIESGSGVIKKVKVDRLLFPISSVLSSIMDFLAASLVFVGMLWYYHVALNPWMLMVVPLVGLQIILTIGLSLLLCSLNAYIRDVKYALPLAIQLLFYATPIVYAISVVPQRLQLIYNLNPMTGLMVAYRNVLVKGISPDWHLLLIAIFVTGIALIVGFGTFKKLEGNFADVL